MRSWPWILLLSVVVAAGSAAQSVYSGQEPEVLAGVLLAADSTNDWPILLQLAHPDALIEFRESQVRMLEDIPDSFAAMDSCMAGIAHLAQFTKQRAAFARHALDSVFQVPTFDSLGHLRPDTVFARYGRYVAGRPVPKHDGLPAPTRTILGALLGPRETAYVLV
jgi:hypothetical protein